MHFKISELSLGTTGQSVFSRATGVEEQTLTKKPSPLKMKRVTFVSDEHLVSIREIPARPSSSRSYSTESSVDDSEDSNSTSSESSDSSSSSDTDDEDSDAETNVKFSKLSVTSSKQLLKMKASNTTASKSKKKFVCKSRIKQNASYQLKARRLRTSSVSTPKHKALGHDRNGSIREQAASGVTSAHKSSIDTSVRRPVSCSGLRTSHQPYRVLSRPSSAVPLINLSLVRCRTSDNSSTKSLSPRKTLRNSNGQVASQNVRPARMNNFPNSGQERTKLYAWQVANGAPLVTTPGITPFCSEQTTITKL